jgi:tRNA uridine 5-carboxymethylaminomethyl modification enzyme
LSALLEKPLQREWRASELLSRPELDYRSLTAIDGIGPGVAARDVAEQVEIQARYAGYIDRQQAEVVRQQREQDQPLPVDFDYTMVRGLSSEACEKLQVVRPETIGQAARIPGITPAAVSLLLVHIKKFKTARKSA